MKKVKEFYNQASLERVKAKAPVEDANCEKKPSLTKKDVEVIVIKSVWSMLQVNLNRCSCQNNIIIASMVSQRMVRCYLVEIS